MFVSTKVEWFNVGNGPRLAVQRKVNAYYYHVMSGVPTFAVSESF